MDWLFVGVPLALITAGTIWWGLRAQRAKPERRWPIVAVGLFAGLFAGLAILQAIWAAGRWPQRRRLIDASAIAVGAGLALLVAYGLYGPPFGLGPVIASGRIERPAAGYALTIPRDWTVEDVSAVREFQGEVVPEGSTLELAAASGDHSQFALVMLVEEDGSVPAEAVGFALLAYLHADPSFTDILFEPVDLPAARTFRIDATREDVRISLYVFTPDEQCFCILLFGAADPPRDHWQPIAETFEFLPAQA